MDVPNNLAPGRPPRFLAAKILLAAFFLASTVALRADTNDLSARLQKGLFAEEANHDLKSAITDYESITNQFDHDRQVAATATYQLGECYRSLGQTNDAIAAYQRIITEFADQPALVALSREDLAGLGASTGDSQKPRPSFMARLFGSQASTTTNLSKAAVTKTEEPDNAGLENQEIQRLKDLLKNSPDRIDVPDNNQTPLEHAAASGWRKAVAFLLDHGASLNGHNGQNIPLVAAAQNGQRTMVEMLLRRNAEVDAGASSGQTALFAAVSNDYEDIVKILLAHHAEVNLAERRSTPLGVAVSSGRPNLVAMLVAAGANPNAKNRSGGTLLLSAARTGDVKAIQWLLSLKADPNLGESRGNTALGLAVTAGSEESVTLLLAAKANPDAGTIDPPLLVAVDRRKLAMAELLLKNGANPSLLGPVDWGESRTPLRCAIRNDDLPMVQLLLKYHADPDDNVPSLQPILFKALTNTNILEALLTAGAKPDAPDTVSGSGNHQAPNWTPLMTAISRNGAAEDFPAASVEILLRHGANPNLADDGTGKTPLQWTTGWSGPRVPNRDVVIWLLDRQADPNHRDLSGKTLLDQMKAGFDSPFQGEAEGFKSIAELLRQHGALDYLPDWKQLTVTRQSANFSSTIFTRQTNDCNQFTLLELVAANLKLLATSPRSPFRAGGPSHSIDFWRNQELAFADLTKIRIHRPAGGLTNFTDQTIDLATALTSGKFGPEIFLKWGDAVEIPETDHALSEEWSGLTLNQLTNLDNYLARHVAVIVRGQTNRLKLAFDINYAPLTYHPPSGPYISRATFWLGPNLLKSPLIRTSSDLAHVKVTRRDPETGKMMEYIMDCSGYSRDSFRGPNPYREPDLWLRDGDVIEVPDKP